MRAWPIISTRTRRLSNSRAGVRAGWMSRAFRVASVSAVAVGLAEGMHAVACCRGVRVRPGDQGLQTCDQPHDTCINHASRHTWHCTAA